MLQMMKFISKILKIQFPSDMQLIVIFVSLLVVMETVRTRARFTNSNTWFVVIEQLKIN